MKPRTYLRSDGSQAGLYHVLSRVCGRQFLLTPGCKDTFVAMMHALAGFCQVQVLTYCVMDNHFHLLLRVPRRPADFDLPLEEVERLWRKAVGKEWSAAVKSQHEIFRQAGAEEAIEQWRQTMLGRMFSLSEFMKALERVYEDRPLSVLLVARAALVWQRAGMKPRTYLRSDGSQAGLYHVLSRVCGRQFLLTPGCKDTFVAMMHALAGFCQVQVLTYCVMDNHFHLLLRVPRRPADFDLPLEEVERLWRKAVGKEWSAAVKSQHEIFRQAGAEEAIEQWRQTMLGRMFSLSEFMKALKQRFTQWHNKRSERCGTLWESRYTSVIVEDEVRSLRTMATYIDLNPVRAGCGDDPADYRWCGYAAAMAGVRGAQQGLARVVHGGPLEERTLFPAVTKARRMRALVEYRMLLGVTGRPRVRADGKVVKRGVPAAVQARLESGAGVRREMLRRRIVHLTRGVIFGSRGFIDEWFERNRAWFGGRSRDGRRSGARSTGEKDLRGLYTLRQLDGSG